MIRSQLKSIDSTGGAFWDPKPLPGASLIVDHAHLTLQQVADHYPDWFGKLRSYQSYAIVREPVARFWSAVYQRINARAGYGAFVTRKDILREAGDVLKMRNQWSTDPTFVHFIPQRDFIYLLDEKVVKNVFPIEHLAGLCADLSMRCGLRIRSDIVENASIVYTTMFAKRRIVQRALNYGGTSPLKKIINTLARSMVISNRPISFVDDILSMYQSDAEIYDAARSSDGKNVANGR
jgi:hypothetical protein